MITRPPYRSFIITRGSPRQCWVAKYEGQPEVEFVHEDLGEVESQIDRWHDDQWNEAVADVDAQGEKLDATQEDNARIADGLAEHGRAA